MRTVRRNICAAVMALIALASISSARAEYLSARELVNGGSLSIKPDDVHQMDTGATAQSREDDASKVTDLEATRAAIDRHAAPALSLGVSGWVGEEVIRAH